MNIREGNFNYCSFKFDNFSQFQNVISDSTPPLTPNRERHHYSLLTKVDM